MENLLSGKEETWPNPQVNNNGRKPLPSTYINNISQLLEKNISTTDWLAEITLSLNELSRHLTFVSFSPNEYVGNSTTWMGFGFVCPMCYSQMNDAAYNSICIYLLNSKLTLVLLYMCNPIFQHQISKPAREKCWHLSICLIVMKQGEPFTVIVLKRTFRLLETFCVIRLLL